MDSIGVELATSEDILQINEISKSHWEEDGDYDYNTLKKIIEQGYSFCLKNKEEVLAFCLIEIRKDLCEIYLIAVKKGYTGKGYGKAILGYSISNARCNGYTSFKLHTSVTNIIAINLYSKFGFVITREKLKYYKTSKEEDNDAYVMELNDSNTITLS